MMRTTTGLLLVLHVLSACGGSTGLSEGECGDAAGCADARIATDAGARVDAAFRRDATVSADAGDPCTGAVDGAACTVEGTSCGGPCTNACQFCNILRCDGSTWTRIEVFPAPCFDCGTELDCVAHQEYCAHEFSDVSGFPDAFECRSLPVDCIGDASCACLEDFVVFDMCVDSGDARIELRTFGG